LIISKDHKDDLEQPVPERMELKFVVGMEIRILNGQVFSKGPIDMKRGLRSFQDSDFYFVDHFESHRVGNGLYYTSSTRSTSNSHLKEWIRAVSASTCTRMHRTRSCGCTYTYTRRKSHLSTSDWRGRFGSLSLFVHMDVLEETNI